MWFIAKLKSLSRKFATLDNCGKIKEMNFGKQSGVDWMIELNGVQYNLIHNEKDGFQEEALEARNSEILKKYDYIVGDWGYEQLRLRGFYEDTNEKAGFDSRISTLEDYLYEFCNFGCAYFVLQRIES